MEHLLHSCLNGTTLHLCLVVKRTHTLYTYQLQFTQIAWNYLSCMSINHTYNIFLFRVFHETTTSMIMAIIIHLNWVCLFFAASRLNISMRKPSMKFLLNCGETPINLSLEGWDCSSKDGAKVGLDWQFIPLAGFNHQLRSWR